MSLNEMAKDPLTRSPCLTRKAPSIGVRDKTSSAWNHGQVSLNNSKISLNHVYMDPFLKAYILLICRQCFGTFNCTMYTDTFSSACVFCFVLTYKSTCIFEICLWNQGLSSWGFGGGAGLPRVMLNLLDLSTKNIHRWGNKGSSFQDRQGNS